LKAWFQRLTDTISTVQSEETLTSVMNDLVQDLDFEGYAFLHLQPTRTFAISNYAQEWRERYFNAGYSQVDPVVKYARSAGQAFIWSVDMPDQSASRKVRQFWEEAKTFGISSGISIPVRTAFRHISVLSLASSRPVTTLDEDFDPIAAATAVGFLHARIEHLGCRPTVSMPCELTPKQALCLKWSAEGKTMRDIAALENMSFATVNFHLNNARKALDASSLAQATALATKLGLI